MSVGMLLAVGETDVRTFLQTLVVGVSIGSAFALVGISFVLIFRTTGIINFAQGAFAVMGGLFTAGLVDDVPTWVAGTLAVMAVAAIGAAIGFVAMGFRGRTTSLASLIITLGIALVVAALEVLEFGDRPHNYPGISETSWSIWDVVINPQYALVVAVTIVAALLLTLLLRKTIVGNALVACADQVRAAELVGINVRAVTMIAFALSAALSALGWVLLTPVTSISYESDVGIAVNGFAAAAFGGLVSIRLAYLGGLVLGIAEQLVVVYGDRITEQARQYELAAALIVILLLIGWRSRHEVEAT
ncbi:MAG: branched-chain amino acid ABC transporter permease [Actinomycetota bacterium]|nr:branched-chain amino acid ABC transporter permease [Actinomycetota bacterium]